MTKVLRNLGNDVKTMVPAPSCPDQWDYWTASPSEEVELMILLPNSVYVSMRKTWDSTLENVKQDLWDQAMHYPLFGMLHEMSGYVFQFVNSLAVLQDVDDETKRIRDIKPVLGVLVIVERSVEKPEVELNTQISLLIGKGLNEFDSLNSSEVKHFRFRMRTLAEENLEKRSQSKGLQRLRYQCPLRLAESPETPDTLSRHLSNNCFELVTKFTNTEFSFASSVPAERSPQEHIRRVLGRFANSQNMRADQPDNYVLKVCGREEYLYGTNPLIQFLYIQETLYTWNGKPKVTIVSLDILPMLTRNIQFVAQPERRRLPSEHSNTMRRRRHESSWNINMNYTCFVHSVQNLNVEPGRTVEVVCQVGIFHGGKPLCESQKTRVANVTSVGVAEWEQELTFNIEVYNLPRMARLCFSIYEVSKPKGKRSKKGANKEIINKLAWANTQIFDYKEQLRTDGMTLSMWTHVADDTQGDDMLLHPLGTVVSNPNTDSCAELLVKFSNYDCAVPIMFPLQDMVKAFSENVDQVSPHAMDRLHRDFYRLRAAIENDSIYEIHEQDRKIIWAARERFKQEAPELLPKLLSCVEWGNRAEVASVSCMLPAWPEFDRVEVALELLDYAYADAAVRSFAVKCLKNISDIDLLLYLLQLVQTLKHESYLMCDLAIFLLQRAFKNMTIGHYLFWHLRSEMHVPSVSVRFGLILEAYCRGAQDHIHALSRQMTCLDKLRWVTNTIRDNPENREISKAREALKKVLQERHCIDTLCDFFSPVNPSFKCKKIKPSECRVMDSKMRPLLLDFENEDPTGGDIRIILKIGDDLRQDMFTLQMLRIMDSLWKSEGYDFRLSPYNCISMEYAVGMIEVVDRAETVANIQKQKALFNAASTLQKGVLLQWIREINTPNTRPSLPADNSALNRAVDEFTWSCAGYSVATYVLGIADRHPDNIMLKKSGQLFHIDFGHFLGNFKRKYGFKRERAPFVLTHDFIHVINKGQRGSGDNEPVQFTNFKDYCEKAFMILRKHGHLILSLFSMMISTGLPELSSEKDLNYLRDTLVLDQSDEKAIEHFRKKFKEAIKNSLSTSLQWAFHNIDKNN